MKQSKWESTDELKPDSDCPGFGASMSMTTIFNENKKCLAIGSSYLSSVKYNYIAGNNEFCENYKDLPNGKAFVFCEERLLLFLLLFLCIN